MHQIILHKVHTILQYCCISVHIIATCTVSYRVNIMATTTANIGSHHCYTHCQLLNQYRGLYSQYWFTSLLHALSVIEPISRLLQPILAHIIVTCTVTYRTNIAATIANIGSHHCNKHCQLSSQYRCYNSKYWFTSL